MFAISLNLNIATVNSLTYLGFYALAYLTFSPTLLSTFHSIIMLTLSFDIFYFIASLQAKTQKQNYVNGYEKYLKLQGIKELMWY